MVQGRSMRTATAEDAFAFVFACAIRPGSPFWCVADVIGSATFLL
jgi:hypothetical protein